MTWDDMKMDMREPVCLGEQRHVRLVAARRHALRARDRPQQQAEFFGLRGGQLIQRGHVPAGHEYQPSGQRCPERVRDSPPRPDINPLSRGKSRRSLLLQVKQTSSSAIVAV